MVQVPNSAPEKKRMVAVVAFCGAQAVEDKQQQLETNLLQEVVHEEKHAYTQL